MESSWQKGFRVCNGYWDLQNWTRIFRQLDRGWWAWALAIHNNVCKASIYHPCVDSVQVWGQPFFSTVNWVVKRTSHWVVKIGPAIDLSIANSIAMFDQRRVHIIMWNHQAVVWVLSPFLVLIQLFLCLLLKNLICYSVMWFGHHDPHSSWWNPSSDEIHIFSHDSIQFFNGSRRKMNWKHGEMQLFCCLNMLKLPSFVGELRLD